MSYLIFVVPASSFLGQPGQGLQVLQSVQHHNKFMMAAGVVTSLKYDYNYSST